MGMFSRIFGRNRPEFIDANAMYARLMEQSRKPSFYGPGRYSDSYEGRIDCLTLHMAIIMKALQGHGENGEKLSQALFDVMVDDFDIALREEGLTDSGVKRRIKPMVKYFYARLKAYDKGLAESTEGETITLDLPPVAIGEGPPNIPSPDFLSALSRYALDVKTPLGELSLGQLARAKFALPDFIQE